MATLQNIKTYLIPYNKIRLSTNDPVDNIYIFKRPADLLNADTNKLKSITESLLDETISNWNSLQSIEPGDKINQKILYVNLAVILDNQNLIRDKIVDNYGNLDYPNNFSEDLPYNYQNPADPGSLPTSLQIFPEEFSDNDILNRPYYRLWLNNHKIADWLRNIATTGYPS